MPFDPYITPWKTAFPETGYPDSWPGWTSPDIFVDNTGSRVETTSTAPHTTGPFEYWVNVNEPGEPEIGVADNRLFVVVTNRGSTAGTTQVTVGYTPYALVGGTSTQLQFKQIAQYPVSLGSAGSPTAQLQTEVQWDLSDVTERRTLAASVGCVQSFVRAGPTHTGKLDTEQLRQCHLGVAVADRTPARSQQRSGTEDI